MISLGRGARQQHFGHPAASSAIPAGWHLRLGAIPVNEGAFDRGDPIGAQADKSIGPVGDGNRALGVVAKSEARDAKERRLLLDAARVRQHSRSFPLKRQEVEISGGIEKVYVRVIDAVRVDRGASARVRGKHDGNFFRNRRQSRKQTAENFFVINIRRAMQRRNSVFYTV